MKKVLLDLDLILEPIDLGVGIPKSGFAEDSVVLVQVQHIKLLLLGLVWRQIESDVWCLSIALRG